MPTETRIATTVAAIALSLACLSSSIQARAVTSPLKVRFNSELIRDIFYKNDQDILGIFSNISLGEFDLKNGYIIKDARVDIVPTSGDLKDFDCKMSLDENKFLGLDASNLKFKGVGEVAYGDAVHQFELEGPIQQLRFAYDIKQNEKGTYEFKFKSFDFALDQQQIQVTAIGEASTAIEAGIQDVKKWVHDELTRMVNLIKDDTMEGAIHYMQKLPLLNLTPLVTLYHLVAMAENVNFSDEFVEYGFTPQSMNMIKGKRKIKEELLKPIDTKYAPIKPGDEPSALQMIIDENFVNFGFQQLISRNKKFSIREFMSRDPRFALFRQLLTTSTMGMAIPAFKEEYGEGKPIDIISSVSHKEIQEILEDTPPSGFTLDSKGNFKVFLNVVSMIIVEKKPGKWEDSRKMVLTFGMKGKIFISDAEFDNKTLVVYPRGLELSTLKIFKGDEEQFLEQMLAQSLIGVQLDQIKKGFTPKLYPLKNFENPEELECFGFNFTNFDVKINKAYLQINANYKKIETPSNPEYCQEFEQLLREKPERMVQLLSDYIPGLPSDLGSKGTALKPGDMTDFAKRMGAEPMEKRRPSSRRKPKKEEPKADLPKFNIPEDVAQDLKEEL